MQHEHQCNKELDSRMTNSNKRSLRRRDHITGPWYALPCKVWLYTCMQQCRLNCRIGTTRISSSHARPSCVSSLHSAFFQHHSLQLFGRTCFSWHRSRWLSASPLTLLAYRE